MSFGVEQLKCALCDDRWHQSRALAEAAGWHILRLQNRAAICVNCANGIREIAATAQI